MDQIELAAILARSRANLERLGNHIRIGNYLHVGIEPIEQSAQKAEIGLVHLHLGRHRLVETVASIDLEAKPGRHLADHVGRLAFL